MASKAENTISKSPAIINKQKYISNQEILILKIQEYINIYENLKHLKLINIDQGNAIVNRLMDLKNLANKC